MQGRSFCKPLSDPFPFRRALNSKQRRTIIPPPHPNFQLNARMSLPACVAFPSPICSNPSRSGGRNVPWTSQKTAQHMTLVEQLLNARYKRNLGSYSKKSALVSRKGAPKKKKKKGSVVLIPLMPGTYNVSYIGTLTASLLFTWEQ